MSFKSFASRIGQQVLRQELKNSRNGCAQWYSNCQRTFMAATLRQYGAPLELVSTSREVKLRTNELKVRVDSAGINNADLQLMKGVHHLKPPLPFVPGFELAGEVLEIGEKVSRFKVGDRVAGLKTYGNGAFAQFCVLDEEAAYAIPHSLDYETAASLLVAYGTAYLALQKVAKIKENDYVLVLTSQGSTGLAAIDLALNVFRCRVIAGTESEEKCALVRPWGVLSTVEYTDEDLPKNVLHATKGAGVDVVVDTVGGFWFDLALKCMKPGGHLLSLGFSSRQIPAVSLQDLIRYRLTVSGVLLGGLARQYPKKYQRIIEEIIYFLDEKFINPHIAAKFKLENVNDAINTMEKKSSLGKFILTLR